MGKPGTNGARNLEVGGPVEVRESGAFGKGGDDRRRAALAVSFIACDLDARAGRFCSAVAVAVRSHQIPGYEPTSPDWHPTPSGEIGIGTLVATAGTPTAVVITRAAFRSSNTCGAFRDTCFQAA